MGSDNTVSEQLTASEWLIVDLDGTLIQSDLLHETFWSAFSANWRTPFNIVIPMIRSRAALKRILADTSNVDVALLPYDEEVQHYIREWRAKGGQVALVTASDQKLANQVAEHLGVFDEVHGSDGERNLKGERKAAFLVERYGENQFVYMGDSAADLPVWEVAKASVMVGASKRVRDRVEKTQPNAEYLSTPAKTLIPILKAIRPHQWLKNALVFLPMLVAHQFEFPVFLQSVAAFIAFSLVASSVYILNDLLDLSSDRAHPRKCKRPLASGSLRIAHGLWLAPILLLAGASISFWLGENFSLVMLGYYTVTLVYSLYLKRRLIIDICTLATLYTLRIIAGGAATDIPLSVWILAFSIFCFFSLATIKRQAELVESAARGKLKATGRGYHVEDQPIVAQMATASGYVSVLILALYINSPAVSELYSQPLALWGICLVLLYWISRMVMVTHRGEMHDDPIVYAVKDRTSQICFVVIACLAVAGAVL
ncbi:MAG: UbiA family prenyltransferase [Parvibaculaceae bacterium]|nr:UbiA family prenyltransferase [Parvibaculaceae bacterium]